MTNSTRKQVACRLLGLSEEDFWEIVRLDPAAEVQRTCDLIRIARALAILLPSKNGPADWLRAPNSASLFVGASAIDVIRCRVEALHLTRQYLEAEVYR